MWSGIEELKKKCEKALEGEKSVKKHWKDIRREESLKKKKNIKMWYWKRKKGHEEAWKRKKEMAWWGIGRKKGHEETDKKKAA